MIAVLLLCTGLWAQVDRSEPPIASGSPQLEFGDYKVYDLKNGLKVIVVENHKLPRLSINLFIDRDPILEGAKAGYVSLAGEMMRQGTENLPKDELDETIDFMGASLSTSSQNVSASGLSKYSEKLVELMADVALNPAFPQEEFDKIKKQQISGLETEKDDPSALANRLFNTMLYGKNHPYGEFASIESTEKVNLEDCKADYETYWKPNYSYLIFVGDIKAKTAKKLAKTYFADWQAGELPQAQYADPAEPTETQISIIDRSSSVQTVLDLGNTIKLKPGDPDIAKLALANQILGGGSLGRLFQNIREDKGYTYGAYSNYDEDPLIGEFNAGASVRTEVTDSALTEFLYELNRMRNEDVPEQDLQAAKNYIIGAFGRSLERAQTMARFALNIQRYDLPSDYYEQYLTKLSNVSAAEVREAANRYFKTENMHITAVGKATAIADKLAPFGNISYYDYLIEPAEAPQLEIPEGLTARKVLDDYLAAIGGRELLENIQDVEVSMSVEIAGFPQAAAGKLLYLGNDKYLMDISVDGMGTLQKQVINGDKAMVSGMQGSQEVTGEELADMKVSSKLIPELHYDDMGVSYQLSEMANIEGETAYALEITLPSGKKETHFFSAESGLKLKTSATQEAQGQTFTQDMMLLEYQNYDGLMMPSVQKLKTGPQGITMKISEVKINAGDITEADFN